MKEPISLKEILAVVIRKGNFLICMALAVAVLLGGYRFVKLRQEAAKPENSPEQIQARYEQAVEDYEERKAALEKSLAKAQGRLQRQEIYNENSILMVLDPFNTARCTMILAVSDLEIPEEQGTQSAEERAAKMITKIQELYQLYWKSADLKTALMEQGYEEVEEKYHRETVGVEITAGGTLTITALAQTPQEATRLANTAYDCLQSMRSLIEAGSYPHDLSVVSSVSKMVVINEIENRQETAISQYKSYAEAVETLSKQLAQLQQPVAEAGYGTGEILKATVKWMIVGGIAGVVLGCVWVLVMFLFRSKAESSRQLEKLLGIPFLGSAAKRGDIWNRLADKLLSERTWRDPKQASDYITESLKVTLEDRQELALVTTLSEKKTGDAMLVLETAAQEACGKTYTVYEAEKNPQTPGTLARCKTVVLAERINASQVPRILTMIKTAERMGVQVVGFVTL